MSDKLKKAYFYGGNIAAAMYVDRRDRARSRARPPAPWESAIRPPSGAISNDTRLMSYKKWLDLFDTDLFKDRVNYAMSKLNIHQDIHTKFDVVFSKDGTSSRDHDVTFVAHKLLNSLRIGSRTCYWFWQLFVYGDLFVELDQTDHAVHDARLVSPFLIRRVAGGFRVKTRDGEVFQGPESIVHFKTRRPAAEHSDSDYGDSLFCLSDINYYVAADVAKVSFERGLTEIVRRHLRLYYHDKSIADHVSVFFAHSLL